MTLPLNTTTNHSIVVICQIRSTEPTVKDALNQQGPSEFYTGWQRSVRYTATASSKIDYDKAEQTRSSTTVPDNPRVSQKSIRRDVPQWPSHLIMTSLVSVADTEEPTTSSQLGARVMIERGTSHQPIKVDQCIQSATQISQIRLQFATQIILSFTQTWCSK